MSSENVATRTGFQQFRDEFGRYWQNLPYKGLFLCLLAGWLALFHFLGNSTLGYTNRPSLLAKSTNVISWFVFGWTYQSPFMFGLPISEMRLLIVSPARGS